MIIFGGNDFDPWKPTLPAHLCDRCRYVTFNDPDDQGEFLCNVCRRKEQQ